MSDNEPTKAFAEYCRDPVVQMALARAADTITEDLLRDCFMAGAQWASRLHIALRRKV